MALHLSFSVLFLILLGDYVCGEVPPLFNGTVFLTMSCSSCIIISIPHDDYGRENRHSESCKQPSSVVVDEESDSKPVAEI